jgi:(p)ppGpp synthase/HD superfamily hydrolase
MILSARFSDALTYATDLHANQQRKISGAPYVGHLLSVASIVLQFGGNEDEAIGGLLHDAVEDQGGQAAADDIRRRFGDRVAELAVACSDTMVTPKPPWRQRKEAHVAHMRRADESVRLIVAADKLDNARSILADYRLHGEALWQHFRGAREGTLWYYRAMIEALGKSGRVGRIVAEVEYVVEQLEQLVARQNEK